MKTLVSFRLSNATRAELQEMLDTYRTVERNQGREWQARSANRTDMVVLAISYALSELKSRLQNPPSNPKPAKKAKA